MRPRESRLATPEPLSAGDEIRNLRDEMHVLREAVDELREQLEYALRNAAPKQDAWLPTRAITSFPVDPTAPDWAARVNSIDSASMPPPSPADALPEHLQAADERRSQRLMWADEQD
jgi:hypothetical protein